MSVLFNFSLIPTDEEAAAAADASRRLSAVSSAETLDLQVPGGGTVPLPPRARELLGRVLAEMAQGNAVTLVPVHAELTTQEAADYLGVSRPHLVRLLDRRVIAFHKAGSHRRVKFSDLSAYKAARDADASAALDELVAEAQRLGLGY